MSEPIIIDLDRPTVPITSYSDVFWSRWLREQHRIEYAIRMVCVRMRYYGCIEDVVSETLLRCQTKWPGFIGDNFVNWVSWEAKSFLADLYRHDKPALSLQEPDEDGNTLEDIVAAPGPGIEDIVISDMGLKQLMLLCRDKPGAKILEALSALIDADLKPSLRNIASIVGVSHTQVAIELAKLRETLQNAGITLYI